MNKTTAQFAALITTAVFLAGTSAFAQGLEVSASGTKTVTISDKVGDNQINWVSDAPLEKIQGTAEGISGSFKIDPKNLSTITGTISAQVSTMKTGNAKRDEHLKSENWLDAEKYPTITFAIASVSDIKVKGNSATAVAHGTFTMHGVSKHVHVPIELKYIVASDATRKRAPGDFVMVEATFSIALKDFNVKGVRGMVGKEVGETINITAKLFGSTAS